MIDPSSSPVSACPQCARLVELEALVRDLQERLNRNSSNSSIPPPANPLDAPKPVVKAPSGRKPSGQSGHPGRHRYRLPPERVENIVPDVPTVRLALYPALWLFAAVEGVEPTNKSCETNPALGHAVAEERLRLPKCGGVPVRGADADRGPNPAVTD